MDLISLLIKFEGLKLKAYVCPGGVETIGIGTTVYPDGRKVKIGDVCTEKEAIEYCRHDLEKFKKGVSGIIPATLPQQSVDALVSFAYNCGLMALSKSTLLKKIKADKNDLQNIEKEFMKWTKAAGKELPGLMKRRRAEYEMYRDGILSQYTKTEVYEMFKCNLK